MKKLAHLLAPLVLIGSLAFAQTTTPSVPVAQTTTATTCSIAAVNVNTATAAEIAKIPGIGAKLADLIVKVRPFKDEADLVKKVKGIGKKNIVKFRPCFLYK